MKKLKIGKSDIHGKGLFSGEPIRKGELIAKVHSGIQLDPETVKYMPTQFGRFYNHDEQKFNTRNEVIGNHRYLRALKNIPANTELTANYREHPDMEQPENFDQGKYASFDFDKTIATDEGLAKARQMLKDGYNLFIVSARDKVTPDMVARARKAGIPEENIIATGSDEAKVRKVKQLGVEKHFDDKPEVIAALGLVGEQFKKGGGINSKRYTKSITGTNKLFTKNNLFKKKSTKRIYDPNAKYFDNGGINKLEGDLISKVLMERNRGVDFVDRAFALGDNPGTPMFNLPDDEQFGQNMSHKMAWGEDDNGQAWMYPTIMNPNDEAIQVPNQYADYISSEGYKNATGMNPYKAGGALLTKKVTCKKCGWSWDAADGGNDLTTCHKCGGQGLIHARNGGDISIASLNQFNNGGPNSPTGPEGGNNSSCEEGYLWDAEKNLCVPIVNMEDWFSNWYANRQIPFEEIPNKKYVNLMKERLPYYNPESTLLEHIQTAIPPVVYKPELTDPMGQGSVVFNQKTGFPENIEIRESLKNTPTELNATLLHEASTTIDDADRDKIFPAQNMVIDPGLVMFDDRWGDLKGMDRENAELAYDYQTDPEQDNIHSLIFEERYKRDLKPNQTITEEDINNWRSEAESSGALDRSSKNFDHTLYTLFKLAKDNKSLSNWFNQLASNDTPKNDDEPQYAKQGGSMGYQLGDEVDEATMKQLINQGYVFEKIR
jgi:hypothetical protein